MNSFDNILGVLTSTFISNVINKFSFGSFININSPDSRYVKTNCVEKGELTFRNYRNSIQVKPNDRYLINGTFIGVDDNRIKSDTSIVENGITSISFIKVFLNKPD